MNKTEEEHSPSAPFPLLHIYDFKLKIQNCDTSVRLHLHLFEKKVHFVVCLGPGYSVLECESRVM